DEHGRETADDLPRLRVAFAPLVLTDGQRLPHAPGPGEIRAQALGRARAGRRAHPTPGARPGPGGPPRRRRAQEAPPPAPRAEPPPSSTASTPTSATSREAPPRAPHRARVRAPRSRAGSSAPPCPRQRRDGE